MELADGMYTTIDQHQIGDVCNGGKPMDQLDYYYTFGPAVPGVK
jgi:hypothetical protein